MKVIHISYILFAFFNEVNCDYVRSSRTFNDIESNLEKTYQGFDNELKASGYRKLPPYRHPFSRIGVTRDKVEVDSIKPFSNKNVALEGDASQSCNYTPHNYDAGRCNNGNFLDLCHTCLMDKPWFRIKFKKEYSIEKITIWNRSDCCKERLNGASVSIVRDDRVVNTRFLGNMSQKKSNTLDYSGITGNVVKVQLPGSNRLNFAEIQVFGNEVGAGNYMNKVNLVSTCVESNGNSDTARYLKFVNTKEEAVETCNNDDRCVAFAFNNCPETTTIFYSNGDACQTDCSETRWIDDPYLINGSSGKKESCYVKPVIETILARTKGLDDLNIRKAVVQWSYKKKKAEKKFGPIEDWDTSKVTNMMWLFKSNLENNEMPYADFRSFNEDLSKWDISRVTDMTGMFKGAKSFNQDLCSWLDYDNFPDDTDVTLMFDESGCQKPFNPKDSAVCKKCDDITVIRELDDLIIREAVVQWSRKKKKAEKKFGPIEDWDTSKVTNMMWLFKSNLENNEMPYADFRSFNEDLSKWDISRVTDMTGMFKGAKSFNQDLCSWLDYDNFPDDTDVTLMFDKSGCDMPFTPADSDVCKECKTLSRNVIYAEKTSYVKGEDVTLIFGNYEDYTPKDWIGLYRSESPVDRYHLVWWIYANGCSKCTWSQFSAKYTINKRYIKKGLYQLYLFHDNKYSIKAVSSEFSVN